MLLHVVRVPAAGKRSTRSLAAYGAYLRAIPSAAEQGLRMVIGAAVKEAAARGVVLQPLFSLYSFHGPVFRVLLRVTRSREWPAQHYGFLAHCYLHGQTYVVPWDKLGGAYCRCCRQQLKAQKAGLIQLQSGAVAAAAPKEDMPHSAGADTQQNAFRQTGSSATAALPDGVEEQVVVVSSRSGYQQVEEQQSSHSGSSTGNSSTDLRATTTTTTTTTTTSSSPSSSMAAPSVLSGPQWTGPLHDAAFVAQLAAEAEARGWRGSGVPPGSPHMVRQSRNNK
jgi:tRNA G26 N,N-dimethylase Trm1